jgi:hypothetical protein
MIVMIVPKPPEYDKGNLKSMIKVLAEELRLLGRHKFEIPEEASEEELQALFNELRHTLLEVAVDIIHAYLKQFPFEDLFTDEKSMVEYLARYFKQIT